MEEIIIDLNKKFRISNTCARNAQEEVKKLRHVTNASKKKIKKSLSKDT